MRVRIRLYVLLLLLLSLPAAASTPGKAAIASAHPLATEAGFEILAAGGNAFDAAVAVTAVLAVVEPYSSGLGGGGFYLLHRAEDRFEVMIDARETAPSEASADMYLDEQGEPVPERSREGALAAGIPGIPAALVHLAGRYGQLPLSKSLAPAVRHAREGFEIGERYRMMAGWRAELLRRYPAAAEVFLVDGQAPETGEQIVQADLARTLERIAERGADGFYRGEVADKLVEGVRGAGGIWRRADLAEYKIIEREPVRGDYRGMVVTSAALPSSGGVVLIQALNILSRYELEDLHDAQRLHLVIEALRRAYRDRAEYLGDADFVDVPLARLLDPDYAAGLSQSIRLDRAMPSRLLPGAPAGSEGEDTTHFSVIDRHGNRVAATLSVNFPFGSGYLVPGSGVILNNEMDDFAAKAGVPNGYGLVAAGGNPNAVAPGKRMLSSMTPTFLDTGDRLALIGTPGGSRIISMVLLGALAFHGGADAGAIVARPRFHHQFLPDVVQFEPEAFDQDTRLELQLYGHRLEEMSRLYGNMQLVIWDKKRNALDAASDPRGEGLAGVR